MNKIIGCITIIVGLLILSLLISVHPGVIFGPALIGFGLGFLICS
jgi:hypothetical protein